MINLLRDDLDDSGYFCFLIKIVPILNWLEMVFVTMNQIMETAILMVAIVPQTYLPQPKLQLQELVVATQDGLVIIFVMISITM